MFEFVNLFKGIIKKTKLKITAIEIKINKLSLPTDLNLLS